MLLPTLEALDFTEPSMPHYMCRTCGTEHAESLQPPQLCRICSDERQYVGWQEIGRAHV